MRVLFDQGTPAPLRHLLTGHDVSTAYELGWSTLKNGELLAAAESHGFELLPTTDTQLKYQQNLAIRRIAVVVHNTTSFPSLSGPAAMTSSMPYQPNAWFRKGSPTGTSVRFAFGRAHLGGQQRVLTAGRFGAAKQLAPALTREKTFRFRRTGWPGLTTCNRSITLNSVFSVKALPEFTSWLDHLTDAAIRGVVVSRIKRLERGLLGDVELVGDGVSELRIHIGAGWR